MNKFLWVLMCALVTLKTYGLVPPWWITDGNQTWPKTFWIGAQLEVLDQVQFSKLKKNLNNKLAKHNASITYFNIPRITLTEGTVENADAIRDIYRILENISWNGVMSALTVHKIDVDEERIGLSINFNQLREFSDFRRDDLLLPILKLRENSKNLSNSVIGSGIVIELGYVVGIEHGFNLVEPIQLELTIKQIEYLVMPVLDSYKNNLFDQTEEEFNKPMYRSGTFYAKGVLPIKRPKNYMPGRRWIAPNLNSLKLRIK